MPPTENNIKGPMEVSEASTEPVTHESDIDAIIALLDGYTTSGGSRMKINVVDGEGSVLEKQYHHGRCDVGSPWAKGQAFDVLEDPASGAGCS